MVYGYLIVDYLVKENMTIRDFLNVVTDLKVIEDAIKYDSDMLFEEGYRICQVLGCDVNDFFYYPQPHQTRVKYGELKKIINKPIFL